MEFKKRTWGWYCTIYSAKNFKIKFLYFKRGLSCSMQRHWHRDELWCFLFGKGVLFLKRNDALLSTPKNCGNYAMVNNADWHQYKAINPTLVLEIQTGDCREEDIERAA